MKRTTTAAVAGAAVLAMTLAACGGGASAADPAQGAAGSGSSAAQSGQLEVFSWWTSGSEDAAEGPHDRLLDGLPGRQGRQRCGRGRWWRQRPADPPDPHPGPDTWQTHLGKALLQYTDANAVVDATSVYDKDALRDVMPKGLIDSMTVNGKIYAVATGAHRGNVLWYSLPALKKAGVTPPAAGYTLDQFVADLEKVKASGQVGLCLGGKDAFAPAELFENTLLGTVGVDGWNQLTSGEKPWNDASVVKAADYLGKVAPYVDPDASALSWDQAAKKLAAGTCAFNSMGDWAYGEMVKAGAVEGKDFGYVPHPGSSGAFVAVVDAFVVGDKAKNQQAALSFLSVVGQKDVQLAFNKNKGSTPVRTDVDTSSLPPYQQDAATSWKSDQLVNTIVHGAAMNPQFVQSFYDGVTQFLQAKDSKALAQALEAAAG